MPQLGNKQGKQTRSRQIAAGTSGGMSRFRMIVVCLALLLEGMSSSSINVQIGAISSDLHLSGVGLQLVASAFLVAYAGLLPVAGRLVDSWNRRTVFLIGIGLFGLGCVVCAGAGSDWVLVAGRFVQGAGAALSAPAALALITSGLVEGTARNRAVALYGAMGAAGFSLGLVVPGAAVAMLGWRASFLLFLPVVALVLAITWPIRVERSTQRQSVDVIGSVLLTVSLIVAMHAIGGLAALSATGLLLHLLAVALMVTALITRGGIAGFPVEVVKSARVASACVGLASVFAGVTASMYVLSLGLTARSGLDAFEVGLLILPQPIFFSLLAGRGARLVTRYGAGRVLTAGIVILAASIAHLGFVGMEVPPYAGVLPAMAGVGIALALCFPAASIAAVDAAPLAFRGTTAGLLTASQNVGGAIGLAVVTALSVVPSPTNDIGIEPGMFVSVAAIAVGGLITAALAGFRPHPWTTRQPARERP